LWTAGQETLLTQYFVKVSPGRAEFVHVTEFKHHNFQVTYLLWGEETLLTELDAVCQILTDALVDTNKRT
jgi:hypothetical protein